MPSRDLCTGLLCAVLLCGAACTSHRRHQRSSALDFLYPKGTEAVPPTDVRLTVPTRVGIAFAPPGHAKGETFTETQKQALLGRVAEAFRGREGIASVEVIPTGYLQAGGGFENIHQLVPSFGIDLIALVSYDQFQFSESGNISWTYWTIIGAYVVEGEEHETRTMLDAVVYDIASRAMLFHASGNDSAKDDSTPARLDRSLRETSEASFERATDVLITNLDVALDAFTEQAKTGTVRGAGTPTIALVDKDGKPVQLDGKGAGALGGGELLLAAMFLGQALVARWRRGQAA